MRKLVELLQVSYSEPCLPVDLAHDRLLRALPQCLEFGRKALRHWLCWTLNPFDFLLVRRAGPIVRPVQKWANCRFTLLKILGGGHIADHGGNANLAHQRWVKGPFFLSG